LAASSSFHLRHALIGEDKGDVLVLYDLKGLLPVEVANTLYSSSEVHAVDTFDFQGHLLADDFGNSARYTHGWFRSSWLFEGPPTAKGFYWDASSIPRF
jgi:hypothetical protein